MIRTKQWAWTTLNPYFDICRTSHPPQGHRVKSTTKAFRAGEVKEDSHWVGWFKNSVSAKIDDSTRQGNQILVNFGKKGVMLPAPLTHLICTGYNQQRYSGSARVRAPSLQPSPQLLPSMIHFSMIVSMVFLKCA